MSFNWLTYLYCITFIVLLSYVICISGLTGSTVLCNCYVSLTRQEAILEVQTTSFHQSVRLWPSVGNQTNCWLPRHSVLQFFCKKLSNELECSDTCLTDSRTVLQGVNEFLPYLLYFWPVSVKLGYKQSARNPFGVSWKFTQGRPYFCYGVNEIRCAGGPWDRVTCWEWRVCSKVSVHHV
jgi:hypothetical protein